MEKKFKGAFAIGMGILILIILAVSYNQIIGNNDAGFYIVKQDLISGKLSIINEPGMFFRGFAKLTKYKISDM